MSLNIARFSLGERGLIVVKNHGSVQLNSAFFTHHSIYLCLYLVFIHQALGFYVSFLSQYFSLFKQTITGVFPLHLSNSVFLY